MEKVLQSASLGKGCGLSSACCLKGPWKKTVRGAPGIGPGPEEELDCQQAARVSARALAGAQGPRVAPGRCDRSEAKPLSKAAVKFSTSHPPPPTRTTSSLRVISWNGR